MSFFRLRSSIPTLFAAALTACGGSTPRPESSPPTRNPDAPDWVMQGSRVRDGRIVGIGFITGVRNADLARSSAANRARAEVSKILEVYSASLMKDYAESTTTGDMSASSEGQVVEQAIKTFSANLMTGTEVKGHWFDAPKNTWFALVELDFEKSRQIAAAKSQMGETMRAWVDANGPDAMKSLEDEMRGRPPAAKPKRPAPKKEAATTSGGDAPGWTRGACDSSRYLCGIGDGPNRTTADNEARGDLAKIFEANIKSVASSFESASQQVSAATGETWVETQKVSRWSMVSTDKVLTASHILERWDDNKGTEWSLAVIDRVQAARDLRDRIEAKDAIVRAKVAAARAAGDQLSRFRALKAAMLALAEREALNADLRVVDASGRGIPPPHDIGELLAMLDTAGANLSIAVLVAGAAADRVQACLEEALTEKGYEVQSAIGQHELPELPGSFDVLIHGQVEAEKRGKVGKSHVINTLLTLRVINGRTKKIIRTFTAARKASRGDLQSAASTSAHQLCTKKVRAIVDEIDLAFGR